MCEEHLSCAWAEEAPTGLTLMSPNQDPPALAEYAALLGPGRAFVEEANPGHPAAPEGWVLRRVSDPLA